MSTELTENQKIAKLNDEFRQNLPIFMLIGQAFITREIAHLPEKDRMEILSKVQTFSEFTEDNDPHGEHDFGSFKHNDQKIFWKFDYYDKSMKWGSEDPANPHMTRRILTIMLACEY